jgi:glutamyl-tRNA reductase
VISEAAVLSTCNRFEIYFAATDSYAAFHEATKFLERRSGLPQSVLRKNLFLLSGEDCIWHLMRVSGGLDSLVVGEGQILSQVRTC